MKKLLQGLTAFLLAFTMYAGALSIQAGHDGSDAVQQASTALVPVQGAAAAGTTSAWAGWGSYWFTGYATIQCSSGCYGNLTVNVYWNGSWRAGNSSGYATWANKTVAASPYACGPSRFQQRFTVVASFSGGGYRSVDYWLYLNC